MWFSKPSWKYLNRTRRRKYHKESRKSPPLTSISRLFGVRKILSLIFSISFLFWFGFFPLWQIYLIHLIWALTLKLVFRIRAFFLLLSGFVYLLHLLFLRRENNLPLSSLWYNSAYRESLISTLFCFQKHENCFWEIKGFGIGHRPDNRRDGIHRLRV